MEKELIGQCSSCGRKIYCNGGFLEGVSQEDHSLLCFACQTNSTLGNKDTNSA